MSAKITSPILESGLKRDPKSGAVLSADRTALAAYQQKREASRLLDRRLNMLEERIARLERMLGEKQ